jgi:hypothetical protein
MLKLANPPGMARVINRIMATLGIASVNPWLPNFLTQPRWPTGPLPWSKRNANRARRNGRKRPGR